MQHFFPHRVEKHNYQAASSRQGKLTNWATLNRKVLSKFGFTVPADVVENIIAAKPNVVEVFLNGLKKIIERELNRELDQVLGCALIGTMHETHFLLGTLIRSPLCLFDHTSMIFPRYLFLPRFIFSTNNFCQFYEPHQYLEAVPKTRKQMPKPRPAQAPKEDLMSTIQAGIPLKNLNLRGLDTDTKLILAEKEQSLLGLG